MIFIFFSLLREVWGSEGEGLLVFYCVAPTVFRLWSVFINKSERFIQALISVFINKTEGFINYRFIN